MVAFVTVGLNSCMHIYSLFWIRDAFQENEEKQSAKSYLCTMTCDTENGKSFSILTESKFQGKNRAFSFPRKKSR